METADRQKIGEELNDLLSDEQLGRLQLTTLQYYLHESNPVNGLIRDKTDPGPHRASPRSASGSPRFPCSSNVT